MVVHGVGAVRRLVLLLEVCKTELCDVAEVYIHVQLLGQEVETCHVCCLVTVCVVILSVLHPPTRMCLYAWSRGGCVPVSVCLCVPFCVFVCLRV